MTALPSCTTALIVALSTATASLMTPPAEAGERLSEFDRYIMADRLGADRRIAEIGNAAVNAIWQDLRSDVRNQTLPSLPAADLSSRQMAAAKPCCG